MVASFDRMKQYTQREKMKVEEKAEQAITDGRRGGSLSTVRNNLMSIQREARHVSTLLRVEYAKVKKAMEECTKAGFELPIIQWSDGSYEEEMLIGPQVPDHVGGDDTILVRDNSTQTTWTGDMPLVLPPHARPGEMLCDTEDNQMKRLVTVAYNMASAGQALGLEDSVALAPLRQCQSSFRPDNLAVWLQVLSTRLRNILDKTAHAMQRKINEGIIRQVAVPLCRCAGCKDGGARLRYPGPMQPETFATRHSS